DSRRDALAARRAKLSDSKKAALARRLRGLSAAGASARIPRAEVRIGRHPASFSQQRLWFVDQLVPGSAVYNLGAAVRLEGRLDRSALQRGLTELVRWHDALRTTFHQRGGAVELVVSPAAAELPVEIIDLTGMPPAA